MLTASGMVVDRLGDFSFVKPDFETAQILAFPPKGWLGYLQKPKKYPEGQTMTKVFWRTLLTDRWISPTGEITRASLDASGLPDGLMRNEWDLEDTTKYRLRNDLLCMKPFISAEGRALMIPWDAKPGDVIIVLIDSKVPYVLRKDKME